MPRRPVHRRRAALLTVAGLALAGCGGTHSSGGPAPKTAATLSPVVRDGVQDFDLTGTVSLRFTSTTLVAHPGKIKITFHVEKGSAPHNFEVDGLPAADVPAGGGVVNAGDSASSSFTVTTPGRYAFVCTIHPSSMKGTLVVS